MAYALARRTSREPETFGRGHLEGIVEASAANNASLGGARVPASVFGISGDSVTAIVVGILYVEGMNPGPTVMLQRPEPLHSVFATFFLANFPMPPPGWPAIEFYRHLLDVPREVPCR